MKSDASQALDQRHGKQRVPAEREEVVVTADALQPQQLGPQSGKGALGRALRCFERTQREGIGLRIGQRSAVELAARRERQRVERDEGRRHHVVGQTRREMLAQRAGIDIGKQRDIGDERLILRTLMPRPRDDHRFAHGGMSGDLSLDLARFDAEPANLDLMVIAAKKLDIAVEMKAREVAGTVDARTRHERVVEETLGGELGPVQIAARHARAADIQLAHGAGRHHAAQRIENIGARVGERLADDGPRLLARDLGDGGIDGALGRTIDVEGADLRGARETVPGLRRERFAAHEHRQRRLPLFEQAGGEERVELRRRAVEHVDARLVEKVDQRHRIGAHVGGNDDEPMSAEQRGEILHRGIERDARVQRDAGVRGAMREHRRVQCVMQIQHMTMLDQHALRLAGRTGRVDRVGEMMRGETGHMRIVLRQRIVERYAGVQHGERARVAQGLSAGRIGDEQHGRRVAENVAQALAGISRIERYIRAARLEDREERGDRADAALHAQRHAVFRTHARRDHTMREPVRARIELRERERRAVAFERDGIGRASSLLLQKLMDAQMLGIRRGRVVPRFEPRLPLGQDELERMQRRIGLGQRLFEQTREAPRMGIHGIGGVERWIAVEHQFDAEFIAFVMDDEREIIGRSIEGAIRSDPASGEIQREAVVRHDVHGRPEERPVGFDASHIASNVLHAIALMAQDPATLP
ncbi:hypothetical protein AWB76_06560 [Caballeronia temeraria]|uniref:Uncharacterized protein n=1 Tax=Caballeronia temeraria TaxID=1777137 RepID=A0A158D7E6_9BURK|nr:hypothetical protein AWB76_06560 [Caballeronia temeraria]